jgi:two-component system, cell cycle response regulator CpdR
LSTTEAQEPQESLQHPETLASRLRIVHGRALTRYDQDRKQKGAMVKIILAEDDADMRKFLVKALEKAGHVVVSFGEGSSAYSEIQQTSFDLLLTDIVMPEMDGIELARKAAEIDPRLKIMFITGFAAVALNPDSKAPKEAKVLSKPFHLRDLVSEVNRLMAA